jgi:hypothetical protein
MKLSLGDVRPHNQPAVDLVNGISRAAKGVGSRWNGRPNGAISSSKGSRPGQDTPEG